MTSPGVHRGVRATAWVALAACAAFFTASSGWVGLVIFGFATNLGLAWAGVRGRSADVALAGVAGWAALLLLALTGPGAGGVARTFGGLAQLGPATATAVAAVLTLALACALVWPAAALGTHVGAALRRLAGWSPPVDARAPGAVTLDPPGLPAAPSGAPLGPSAAAPP